MENQLDDSVKDDITLGRTNRKCTLCIHNTSPVTFADVSLTHKADKINDGISRASIGPWEKTNAVTIQFITGGGPSSDDIWGIFFKLGNKNYVTSDNKCNLKEEDADQLATAELSYDGEDFYLEIVPAKSSSRKFKIKPI